jgi:hypothetical protein
MWSADTTLGKDMLFMLFSDQHFRVGHKEREVGVRKKRNRPKTARNDRIAYCALRDNKADAYRKQNWQTKTKLTAIFVKQVLIHTKLPTKLPVSFVKPGSLAKFHKTCRQFC